MRVNCDIGSSLPKVTVIEEEIDHEVCPCCVLASVLVLSSHAYDENCFLEDHRKLGTLRRVVEDVTALLRTAGRRSLGCHYYLRTRYIREHLSPDEQDAHRRRLDSISVSPHRRCKALKILHQVGNADAELQVNHHRTPRGSSYASALTPQNHKPRRAVEAGVALRSPS
ncbi:hypothetical protein EJ03DRAFT_184876 [Teratosphaeria nubilosa]|uniref:Uncharacterized protein n=1 Tax=Teratosphaeria nubilosa TaxID=161662 RepID=A0A6G1L037_9PEZI|nr:hypothetical protein EJ03DRAFT_184876 [Teratosphaeria nubilosa]